MAEKRIRDGSLFVGLGSPHGDDQAGWLIADRLRQEIRIEIRQAAIPADLLHWIEGVETLYLCDVCQGDGMIGAMHRYEHRRGDRGGAEYLAAVARLRTTGSHNLGLGQVLDWADQLRLLPDQVILWAIEGRSFGIGQALSMELCERLPGIVRSIANEINHAREIAGQGVDPAGVADSV